MVLTSGAGEEPEQVEGALEGGARVCGDEAEVRICEATLSRTEEECHPTVRGVRAGESVLGAEKTVALGTGLARERRLLITGEPPKRAEDRERPNPNACTGLAEHLLPRRHELIQSFPRHFLDQEIAFVQSKIQSIKAPWKVRPHLWWQAGGIYYLLDRIFREASVQPTTQADAHRKIIEIIRKVDHRVLTFDLSKGYCPAICTAIERMSSDYKQLCDQHLQWLDLTLRQR